MALGRQARRAAARQEILRACWRLAGEHGLSGFTLRQVADAVGIRAPSLYSYFASKNAMYDAMFKAAAEEFYSAMKAVPAYRNPRQRLRGVARAYVDFCAADRVRHRLLFQPSLPGFSPSPEARQPAVDCYDHMRAAMADVGITSARHLDLWTALLAGLASHQLNRPPGESGGRRLVAEAVEMFVAHAEQDSVR